MYKLSWFEFFFRLIPEFLIIMWGIHVLLRKDINLFKYILSSLILAVLCFIMRLLPIYFGVHTEICIILTIAITAVFIGTPLIENAQATFLIYFLLSLSESINMLFLKRLNITDVSILQPITRYICSFLSLVIFLILIIFFKFISKKKDIIVRCKY